MYCTPLVVCLCLSECVLVSVGDCQLMLDYIIFARTNGMASQWRSYNRPFHVFTYNCTDLGKNAPTSNVIIRQIITSYQPII